MLVCTSASNPVKLDEYKLYLYRTFLSCSHPLLVLLYQSFYCKMAAGILDDVILYVKKNDEIVRMQIEESNIVRVKYICVYR